MKRIGCVVAGLVVAISAISQAAEGIEKAVSARPPLEVHDDANDQAPIAQSSLARQIAEYNRLLGEKRLSQATEISEAIFREHPNDPAARLMHEHTLLLQSMLDHGVDLGLTSGQREPVSVVYAVDDLVSPLRTDHGESDPDKEKVGEYLTLIQLIGTMIAPKTWEPSGSGSMQPYVEEGRKSLVVRQTLAVHEEIAGLLKELRELNAATVALEVQFVTRPTKLAAFDLNPQNPLKLKQAELKPLLAQPPKRFPNTTPDDVTPMKIKVANGKTGVVRADSLRQLPGPLSLKITPMVGSDWRRLRLTMLDEGAPENAISMELSSDECVAVDVSRLCVPLAKTPVEAALREAQLKSAPRALMVITPRIEHH